MNPILRLTNKPPRLPNFPAITLSERCTRGKSSISTWRPNPWHVTAPQRRVPAPNIANHAVPSSSRWFKSKRTRPPKSQPAKKKVASQNLITDKAVLEFPQIYIVDQSTERLTGPFPSSDVLESLMDFATETIVVVQSRGGGGMFGEDGKSMPLLPVCRIYNREELQQREDELARQAEAKAAAERGRKLKIVEMSWSSDRKDSEVKLKRVQGFLERGHRVELVVYPKSVKKRQPPPTTTMEEMLELVGRVNGTVAGVVGAKEVKTRDGVVGGTLTFFIEGPSPLSKLHGRREDVPVEDVAAEEGAEEVPVQ